MSLFELQKQTLIKQEVDKRKNWQYVSTKKSKALLKAAMAADNQTEPSGPFENANDVDEKRKTLNQSQKSKINAMPQKRLLKIKKVANSNQILAESKIGSISIGHAMTELNNDFQLMDD